MKTVVASLYVPCTAKEVVTRYVRFKIFPNPNKVYGCTQWVAEKRV